MSPSDNSQIRAFIDTWEDTPNRVKKAFVHLFSHLDRKAEIHFDFIERNGLTHSLRAARDGQTGKPLFVMVDVIEEDPRWLSVCFYAELISDPDMRGDVIPGGLLGEDGYCFDIDEFDAADMEYICTRLDEAYENAGSQGGQPKRS